MSLSADSALTPHQPGAATPAQVAALEDQLLVLPQVQIDTTHVIHGGMCARTIQIPAGIMLTGALLNHDNICVVHGDISVTTDEGTQRLTGYHVLPASAGRKRAGVTHGDTWWTMVWRTDETDLAEIEDAMTPESDRLQSRAGHTLGETPCQP